MSGLENMVDVVPDLAAGVNAGHRRRALDQHDADMALRHAEVMFGLDQRAQIAQGRLDLDRTRMDAKAALEAGQGEADAAYADTMGMFSTTDEEGNATSTEEDGLKREAFTQMPQASRRAVLTGAMTRSRDHEKAAQKAQIEDTKSTQRRTEIETGRARLDALIQKAPDLEDDGGVKQQRMAYDIMEADGKVTYAKAFEIAARQRKLEDKLSTDPLYAPSDEDIQHTMQLNPSLTPEMAGAYLMALKNKTARSTVPEVMRMNNQNAWKNDRGYAGAKFDLERAKGAVKLAETAYTKSLGTSGTTKSRAAAKINLDNAIAMQVAAERAVLDASDAARAPKHPAQQGQPDAAPMTEQDGAGEMQGPPAPAAVPPGTKHADGSITVQSGPDFEIVQTADGATVAFNYAEAVRFAAMHPEMDAAQRRAAFIEMKKQTPGAKP